MKIRPQVHRTCRLPGIYVRYKKEKMRKEKGRKNGKHPEAGRCWSNRLNQAKPAITGVSAIGTWQTLNEDDEFSFFQFSHYHLFLQCR